MYCRPQVENRLHTTNPVSMYHSWVWTQYMYMCTLCFSSWWQRVESLMVDNGIWYAFNLYAPSCRNMHQKIMDYSNNALSVAISLPLFLLRYVSGKNAYTRLSSRPCFLINNDNGEKLWILLDSGRWSGACNVGMNSISTMYVHLRTWIVCMELYNTCKYIHLLHTCTCVCCMHVMSCAYVCAHVYKWNNVTILQLLRWYYGTTRAYVHVRT